MRQVVTELWFPGPKPFWTVISRETRLPRKIHLYTKCALTFEVHRPPSLDSEGRMGHAPRLTPNFKVSAGQSELQGGGTLAAPH